MHHDRDLTIKCQESINDDFDNKKLDAFEMSDMEKTSLFACVVILVGPSDRRDRDSLSTISMLFSIKGSV